MRYMNTSTARWGDDTSIRFFITKIERQTLHVRAFLRPPKTDAALFDVKRHLIFV